MVKQGSLGCGHTALWDGKIKEAVVVKVTASGGEGIIRAERFGSKRDSCEITLAIILIEDVVPGLSVTPHHGPAAATPVRHKQIDKTVVVVVAPSAANRVATIVDDAADGDLGEGGIDIQMRDVAGDGAGGVRYDHRKVSGIGQLHVCHD